MGGGGEGGSRGGGSRGGGGEEGGEGMGGWRGGGGVNGVREGRGVTLGNNKSRSPDGARWANLPECTMKTPKIKDQ